jgi:inositol phosphorylceramide mannosyltransferase catalytic subunit
MRLVFSLLLMMYFPAIFAVVREPGFDSGMITDTQYQHNCRKYPVEWGRLKQLFGVYQKTRSRIHLSKAAYKVPKKIHMIWLGSPVPAIVLQMFESWKRFHPGWEVKLWTDADVARVHLKNRQAFDAAKNWGEKSDILRYEILHNDGGIYVDSDFECIKPFDDICKVADFFAGVAYSCGAPHVLNGLIGSRPGHPIMQRCIDAMQVGTGDHDFQRILQATGPHYFSRCLNEAICAQSCGIVSLFPVTYFYPFPNAMRETYQDTSVVKRDWVHPETYAIHYWKISWEDPQHTRTNR